MKRIIRAGMAALAAVAPAGGGGGRADKPPDAGRVGGPGNVAMEIAVMRGAAQGLDVKLVEFSDYISQNEGVNDGSLDAKLPAPAPSGKHDRRQGLLVPVAAGTSRMAILSSAR